MTPERPEDASFPTGGRRHRSSAMPLVGENLAPWLAGAAVSGALVLLAVLTGHQPGSLEQRVLLLCLAAVLTAGGLVAARSNRLLRVSMREERARPSADQLERASSAVRSMSYVTGMARWSGAMLELVEHALSELEADSPERAALTPAAHETRDLHDLFASESTRALTINDHAQLHALGSLWETTQLRVERLAAQVDPRWHRRWKARSVVARNLRHGGDVSPTPLVLPYRT
jgi:hypothetical protein